MLALVVAKGPLSCSKAWASALAGSRRPRLDPPGLRASATPPTAGSTKVTAPGQAKACLPGVVSGAKAGWPGQVKPPELARYLWGTGQLNPEGAVPPDLTAPRLEMEPATIQT